MQVNRSFFQFFPLVFFLLFFIKSVAHFFAEFLDFTIFFIPKIDNFFHCRRNNIKNNRCLERIFLSFFLFSFSFIFNIFFSLHFIDMKMDIFVWMFELQFSNILIFNHKRFLALGWINWMACSVYCLGKQL